MFDKIKVINDNMLSNNNNYTDADFIYISNLCFSDEVNKAIYKKLNSELKDGSIIFSSRNIDFGNNSESSRTTVNQTWNNYSNIHVNRIKRKSNFS